MAPHHCPPTQLRLYPPIKQNTHHEKEQLGSSIRALTGLELWRLAASNTHLLYLIFSSQPWTRLHHSLRLILPLNRVLMASPASPHNPSHILSSEPTPPQEDSMVDPDLSPSRKRPRLDSGSRTMSADRIRSPASLITGDGDAPSSTDNLENQREQSPTRDHVPSLETSSGHIIVARHSSNKENMAQVAPSSSCPSPSLNSMTEHIQLNGNGPESPSTMQQSTYTDATAGDSSSGESPRIEVVMDDSEDAANTRTDSVLTLEEDATVELLRTFPYSKSRNGHLKAALELADHFRTCRFRSCTPLNAP